MENMNSSAMWMPKTISDILIEASQIDDFSMKSARLYVHLLEEELRKIQVFHRELPVCVNLIQDCMKLLALAESDFQNINKRGEFHVESKTTRSSDGTIIAIEELSYGGNGGAEMSLMDPNEKTVWLSAVQLWSDPLHRDQSRPESLLHLGEAYEEGGESRLVQGSNFKNRGGAFVPFKKLINAEEDKTNKVDGDDGLSLSLPTNVPDEECVKARADSTQLMNTMYKQQQEKKSRKC